MNTLILQKCVEELKKENPKIDYILGMLETVIALSGTTTSTYIPPIILPTNEIGIITVPVP